MRYLILATCLVIGSISELDAHDIWSDGSIPPAWIKSACCGKADAHILGPSEYWIDAGGFHIVGIDKVTPLDQVLPSQDGQVWAFYPFLGAHANVYCVFFSGSI
jgi:hypothetical protein